MDEGYRWEGDVFHPGVSQRGMEGNRGKKKQAHCLLNERESKKKINT